MKFPTRGRGRVAAFTATGAAALLALTGSVSGAGAGQFPSTATNSATSTPIKHVVVLFDENNSFDHYFGTYPNAANTDGTKFTAAAHTPKVNGLTKKLLEHNPNSYNPKRLSPKQALTCDQDHNYGAEQKAFNGGKMDKFVQHTETNKCTGQPILFGEPGLVMDYFDGNTVTGLWNYAQHYSMSDNSFNTTFGPSSPGAINLVSGQTRGTQAVTSVDHKPTTDDYTSIANDANGVGTMINDPDPAFDDCSDKNHTADENLAVQHGTNVGDLLNKRKVSWGWFQGGFRPTGSAGGYSVCGATHKNVGGNSSVDYSPHHEPFQYYRSTSNPKHLPPSSVDAIGHSDQANHQYDLTDFHAALDGDNMPAVSFLKAPSYQDGHAGYSDPLDEQRFLTTEINKIQRSPEWKSTAIVVAYDDSDGWYDHQNSKVINGSSVKGEDEPICTGTKAKLGSQGRCGHGPRLPLLVISPHSKKNFVDHTRTDQTSVLNFIEDNWSLGRIGNGSYDTSGKGLCNMFDFHNTNGKLILDPETGAVAE
jgi:phospholipase C